MNRFVNKVLSKIWGDYNIDVWTQNKEFSSFIGSEIRAFNKNIPLVASFFEENFNLDDYIDSLIKGLKLWVDLCVFIHITTIEDEGIYKNEMDTFENKLKLFFTAGGEYFFDQRGSCW